MATGRVKRGQVEMVFRTHGGRRPGAGRKPKGKRPGERHEPRPEHDPRHPGRVARRVTPPGPHRSGQAEFPHPALRKTGLLGSVLVNDARVGKQNRFKIRCICAHGKRLCERLSRAFRQIRLTA